MNPVRMLARPLMSSIFVYGGAKAVADPAAHVPAAEPVTDTVGEVVDVVDQARTENLVRANGAVQVAAGTLLAIGRMPRTAATMLAASLVPTTAVHRFWEMDDPQQRQQHQLHFLKNLSMLGGLMIAAMDTEGEPGMAWRAGHAKDVAARRIATTKREKKLEAKLAKERAKAALTGNPKREAKLAAQLAKERAKNAVSGDPKREAKLAAQLAKERAKNAISSDPRREAKLAGRALKAEAKARKEQARAATADTRATARAQAEKHTEMAGARATLLKEKATPKVTDVVKGVRALRSDDDD